MLVFISISNHFLLGLPEGLPGDVGPKIRLPFGVIKRGQFRSGPQLDPSAVQELNASGFCSKPQSRPALERAKVTCPKLCAKYIKIWGQCAPYMLLLLYIQDSSQPFLSWGCPGVRALYMLGHW